jgi:hypothetical protein
LQGARQRPSRVTGRRASRSNPFAKGNESPRSSLGKFRRAVPEVWFRIVHIAADHVKDSIETREQTIDAIEVALGPNKAFEISECPLRSITRISDPAQQVKAFETVVQHHPSTLPFRTGEPFWQAAMAISQHSPLYSAFRCASQKASVRATSSANREAYASGTSAVIF